MVVTGATVVVGVAVVLAATAVVDETATLVAADGVAVVVAAELLLPLHAANVKMAAIIGHAVLDAVLTPAPPISLGIAGSNKLRGDQSRWKSCKQNWLLTSMATRLVSVRNTLPVSATARVQGSVKGLRARGKGSHLPTEPPPRKAKQHLRNFFLEPVADPRNCLRFFRFNVMVETWASPRSEYHPNKQTRSTSSKTPSATASKSL
jgi:hypothetical protein